MYAVEDCGFLVDGGVDEFLELPIIYASLTHNGDNAFAGGALQGGVLTAKGAELISGLNAKGIAVDTAHLNRKSFFEAAERAERVLCSHTCRDEIFTHKRNLTKEQISVIVQKGGIVGVAAVEQFLGGGRDMFIRHIDGIVQDFGVNAAAIGTDFNGTDEIDGIENYDKILSLRADFLKLGYTDADADAIFYKNACNFFKLNAE
jgi:membrane dipeptidase